MVHRSLLSRVPTGAPRTPTGHVAAAAATGLSRVLKTAEGSVGTLGWSLDPEYPDGVTDVRALVSMDEAVAVAPELAAVVLVGVLSQVDVQAGKLPKLAGALRPSGRLYYCEPTLGLGFGAIVQRFSRVDIQKEIRAAGLRPTTIHRFSAGSPKALNNYIAGEARWYENL